MLHVNDVNDSRPPSAERVPTLTEVVELGPAIEGFVQPDLLSLPELPLSFAEPAPLWDAPQVQVPVDVPVPEPLSAPLAMPAASVDPDALVVQVWAELAPRIDALLESRLREALAPALARAADGLIRDAGSELSATLRAVVEETVAQVLRRHDTG